MLAKQYNTGFFAIPGAENCFFLDQAVHCFQLKVLRTEIKKARIDKKNICDKLGKTRVVVQQGVDGKFWPSALHLIINVNRKNLSA